MPSGTLSQSTELTGQDRSSSLDLYRDADSLIYADHKPSEEDLDRLTNKVNDE